MNSFLIKPYYQIRQDNAPFVDIQTNGIVYQPHVYELAKFIQRRNNFKYIIDIGAGSGEKLKDVDKSVTIIAIDYSPNIDALRENLPNAVVIDFNLEEGLPEIDPKVLENSVVISSDVIEHIVDPDKYVRGLSEVAEVAPFVLISTPDRTRARGPEDFGPPANPYHVREWTIDELYSLLWNYGIDSKIGHTLSNDNDRIKATSLAIFGTQAMYKPSEKLETALAIVTAYNEEDIIEKSIDHLLGQGIDVHIIDNWSSDNTFNIIQKLGKTHSNVTFERFPKSKPSKHKYEWKKILTRVEEVARRSDHDWIMHNDTDELRLSPWKNVTIQQALSFISEFGYNAIDLTVANFRPVKDGFNSSIHPEEFFHDFEFTTQYGYLTQIKGWKNNSQISLAESGGHNADFPNRRVFPLKFITKHYPIRSTKQAEKKIFKDRKNSFTDEERKLGWHVQYDDYKKGDNFIWNSISLNRYAYDYFYTEYMVELLSGIGM